MCAVITRTFVVNFFIFLRNDKEMFILEMINAMSNDKGREFERENLRDLREFRR